MKKVKGILLLTVMAAALTTACAGNGDSDSESTQSPKEDSGYEQTADPVSEETKEPSVATGEAVQLEDGVYTATFETDSSMFKVNETKDGKGTLTVENGEMTIHVSLSGSGILKVYPGTADEAKADEANALDYTEDEVTYTDGTSETVHGFDIPVPYIDEEYTVSIIGSKGVWYDHVVSVSDPVAAE